jgi:hypothetical protein
MSCEQPHFMHPANSLDPYQVNKKSRKKMDKSTTTARSPTHTRAAASLGWILCTHTDTRGASFVRC